MKKKIVFLLLLAALVGFTAPNAGAQAVSIGETEFTPNAGAMLDIRSTNKGVLIPRMTYTQRMYIPTNAESAGLMVYQTDREAGFYYFDGLVWKFLNPNVGTSGEVPNLARVATTGEYSDLSNTPELKPVATTGDYEDLTNKPSIPTKLQDLQPDENYYTTVSRAEREKWNAAAQASLFSGDYNDLANKPGLKPVATSGEYADLQNKPTIPTQLKDLEQDPNYYTTVSRAEREAWNASAERNAFSGSYNDLKNKPFVPENLSDLADDATHQLVTAAQKTRWDLAAAGATFTGSYNDLTDKPALTKVATSGSYADLTDKPVIPTQLGQLESNDLNQTVTTAQKNLWNEVAAIVASGSEGGSGVNPDVLATVAVTGSYNDLKDKPTIHTELRYMQQDDLYAMYVNKAEKDRWDEASNNAVSSTDRERWNAKAETTLASSSNSGLMSTEDKTKLSAIEDGANKYVHPDKHPASMIEEDEFGQRKFVSSAQMDRWENTTTNLNDINSRLKPVATSGDYADLQNKPNLEKLAADISNEAATALYNHTVQPHFSGNFADLSNPVYAGTSADGLMQAAEYNKLQVAYEYTKNPPTSTGETGGLMSAADKRKLDGLHQVATSGKYDDLTGVPMTATTTADGLMSKGDKVKVDELKSVATSGKYDDLQGVPAVLQELESEPSRLPNVDNFTNWNAAYTHSTTSHFSGDYNNLSNKPILLQPEHVTSIVANGNFNQNINGVDLNASKEVTVTAATIKEIFDHATQAAYNALPIGTVIMWTSALGGDISQLTGGSNAKWRIFREMQGRFPVAAADYDLQNNGLTQYAQGCNGGQGGTERVALKMTEMPKHNHSIGTNWAGDGGGNADKINNAAEVRDGRSTNFTGGTPYMSEGESEAHENRPPYYGLIFLIKVK